MVVPPGEGWLLKGEVQVIHLGDSESLEIPERAHACIRILGLGALQPNIRHC